MARSLPLPGLSVTPLVYTTGRQEVSLQGTTREGQPRTLMLDSRGVQTDFGERGDSGRKCVLSQEVEG